MKITIHKGGEVIPGTIRRVQTGGVRYGKVPTSVKGLAAYKPGKTASGSFPNPFKVGPQRLATSNSRAHYHAYVEEKMRRLEEAGVDHAYVKREYKGKPGFLSKGGLL